MMPSLFRTRRTAIAKKPSKPAKPSPVKSRTTRAAPQSEFSQPKKRRPFTVFLIVDDRTIRELLVASLRTQQINVHDYMTAMEFYRDYREPVPGVLISEIRLHDMTGPELLEKLTAKKNELLVAFIAGHAEAPLAVQAMKAEAIDFLVKPVQEGSLMASVSRAYAMYYDVDWDFVGEDLDDIAKSISRLTDREREVLDMVADGLTSREIGAQLSLSTKTADAHRARINHWFGAEDDNTIARLMQELADKGMQKFVADLAVELQTDYTPKSETE